MYLRNPRKKLLNHLRQSRCPLPPVAELGRLRDEVHHGSPVHDLAGRRPRRQRRPRDGMVGMGMASRGGLGRRWDTGNNLNFPTAAAA